MCWWSGFEIDCSQDLVVSNLHLSNLDPPRLLVEPLIVPVRVQVGKLGCQPGVLVIFQQLINFKLFFQNKLI